MIRYDIKEILREHDRIKRTKERNCAIILAKGNSTRFHRKNMTDICGKPLVAWSVIQAVASHLVTDTYVTTDDDEIADVSREYGAKIIWRQEHADGFVANIPIRHAIRQMREWHPVTLIASMLPTQVLRHPGDIDRAFLAYRNSGGKQTTSLCENLEVMLWERKTEDEAAIYLGNKDNSFLSGGCSSDVWTPDGYFAGTENVPIYDRLIDDCIVENRAQMQPDLLVHYIVVEDYQRYDLDLPEQKPLIESIMRSMILSDETDVYADYHNLIRLDR